MTVPGKPIVSLDGDNRAALCAGGGVGGGGVSTVGGSLPGPLPSGGAEPAGSVGVSSLDLDGLVDNRATLCAGGGVGGGGVSTVGELLPGPLPSGGAEPAGSVGVSSLDLALDALDDSPALRSFVLLIEVAVPGRPFSKHRLDCNACSLVELHARIMQAVGLTTCDHRVVVTVFDADFEEFAEAMDLDGVPDQARIQLSVAPFPAPASVQVASVCQQASPDPQQDETLPEGKSPTAAAPLFDLSVDSKVATNRRLPVDWERTAASAANQVPASCSQQQQQQQQHF